MTVVKICGIKTITDACAAVAAGADVLGFNFYPKSPRCIDLETCARITAMLKAEVPAITLVGVFVDATLAEVQTTLQTCRLDLAQLHGDEDPQMLKRLAPYAFKALRGGTDHLDDYARAGAPAFLLDAAVKGAYGGSGQTGDWQAATQLAQRYAFFLAGGLNPGNVAEALRRVRPWGVDVASGVEASPGVKDAAKMKDFVQAVRSVTETGRDSHTVEMEKR